MNETAEKRTSKWGFLGVSRLFFNDESDEYERHSEDLEDAEVVTVRKKLVQVLIMM